MASKFAAPHSPCLFAQPLIVESLVPFHTWCVPRVCALERREGVCLILRSSPTTGSNLFGPSPERTVGFHAVVSRNRHTPLATRYNRLLLIWCHRHRCQFVRVCSYVCAAKNTDAESSNQNIMITKYQKPAEAVLAVSEEIDRSTLSGVLLY